MIIMISAISCGNAGSLEYTDRSLFCTDLWCVPKLAEDGELVTDERSRGKQTALSESEVHASHKTGGKTCANSNSSGIRYMRGK